MTVKTTWLRTVALGVVGIAQCGAAQAQGGTNAIPESSAEAADDSSSVQLSEIVVTAQKRTENSQKVPVAVTAFSSEALQMRGMTDLREIAAITPGLQLGESNGVVLPFLRGVGNRADAIGNESSVAVYVDGVYFTRVPSGVFTLTNIDRVEVLKGPQGTLFGRNSSGGVVHIITRDPSHDPQVKGQIGYGNYDTLSGDLYATVGLSSTVAMDISLSGTNQGEGFGRMFGSGVRASFADNFTMRSKLLFQPTDLTKVTVSGFYSYSMTGMLGNTFPGTIQGYQSAPDTVPQPTVGFYDQRSDLNPTARTNVWGVSLKIDQDLDFARLISITGYSKTKAHQITDGEYSERPDYRADLYGTIEQFTQEFQLASNSDSNLSWILGLFYYNTLGKYDPLRFQGPVFFNAAGGLGAAFGGVTDVLGDSSTNAFDIVGRQRAKSYAGYGQATYEIVPRLKITGGLRYTHDEITGSGFERVTINNATLFEGDINTFTPGAPRRGSNKIDKLTYRTAIDYQVTGDALLYASLSRGYKSANFNLLPFSSIPNRPEVLDAYEIGFKSQLFNRRLRVNGAVFNYEIKNPQVQLLNNGSITLSNAGKARVRGVEIEGAFAAARGLTLNFGATYLDAKYLDYANAPSGPPNPLAPFGTITPLRTIDAAGKRTPYAPKLTANFGVQYVFETGIGKWAASADYSYNDGYFFEPDNFLRQQSFNLVNGQIRYMPNDRISAAVWGKNLANERYATFAGTQAGAAGYPFVAAAPRTYGVAFGFNF